MDRWAGPQHIGTRSFSPQAKTSGKFSREELDKLWREFQHHKEKVREYNVLLETLSRTEGASGPAPPCGCGRPWLQNVPEWSCGGGELMPCAHGPTPLSEGDSPFGNPSGCL